MRVLLFFICKNIMLWYFDTSQACILLLSPAFEIRSKKYTIMSLPRKAFLTLVGLLCLVSAHATPIVIDGDHFSVSYDDAQVGPYKSGFLSGSQNTVYFQPNTLNALSGGIPFSTMTLLQLTLTIDPGYRFAGLSFTERGDYFLFGSGAVDVASSVQLINPATSASTVLDLTPGSPLAQTMRSTPWELSGSLSPLGLNDPQTLQVALGSTLSASARNGGLGFIQKTYAGFRIATEQAATVPEPSSWTLVLAGMLAAVLVGRRAPRLACKGGAKHS